MIGDDWPPDGDPEEEAFDRLIWSVLEERPMRRVLLVEQTSLEDNDMGGLFDDNRRIDPAWISHVRILHRDEEHEPAQVIDRWAPSGLVPLDVLREGDLADVLDWISVNRPDAAPHRVRETVRVVRPWEDDRILMELLDPTAAVITNPCHYYSEDSELLLVEHGLLSTQHLLSYERLLPWERAQESGGGLSY